MQNSDGWEGIPNQILESISDPAMLSDMQGNIAYVNDGMLKLIGLPWDQVVGQSFPYPWLLPKGPFNKIPWVNVGHDFAGVAELESLVTDVKGKARNISFSVSRLLEPAGKPVLLLSIGRDVTPVIGAPAPNTNAHATNAQALLAQAIEQMPEWVQLSSMDGTIKMVNEAGCAISGYSRKELIGQTWPYP